MRDTPPLSRLGLATVLLAGLALFGCIGPRHGHTPHAQRVTQASLDVNLRVIQTLEPQLDALDAAFLDFPLPAQLGRDYFDAEEVDAIEGLLFRFQTGQTSLWDIVNRYGGLDAQFADDPTHTRAEVLALTATLLIASHTALVVDHFAESPVAIDQLNQAYYRSEIPFGSYDRMRESVTAPGLLQAVAVAAWMRYAIGRTDAGEAYDDALNHPDSPLMALATSDPEYGALIRRLPELHDQAETRLQRVSEHFTSHGQAERLARRNARRQHERLYAMRAFVFKNVSRLKSPFAHLVVFTDEQKREIFGLLQPGDLVLTYTSGYMSDVFIPGAFKHGITYVGTPEQRAGLALSAEELPAHDRFDPEKVDANLGQTTLGDGKHIDMIEAVAEGVIFNNLEHIMDTHINRMLVLRPRLSEAERAAFLVGVYSYLGDDYDFRFDFADASRQVCTEVIYRAINGKGSIDFELTERAGHETLSADDIANYHLSPGTDAFEFVLLVEPDPGSSENGAVVYTGAEGEAKLKSLMAQAEKE